MPYREASAWHDLRRRREIERLNTHLRTQNAEALKNAPNG